MSQIWCNVCVMVTSNLQIGSYANINRTPKTLWVHIYQLIWDVQKIWWKIDGHNLCFLLWFSLINVRFSWSWGRTWWLRWLLVLSFNNIIDILINTCSFEQIIIQLIINILVKVIFSIFYFLFLLFYSIHFLACKNGRFHNISLAKSIINYIYMTLLFITWTTLSHHRPNQQPSQ
jgi:hypothetical protein